MNYLLDTHTIIWFLNGDASLSEKSNMQSQSQHWISSIAIPLID